MNLQQQKKVHTTARGRNLFDLKDKYSGEILVLI